MDIAIDAQGHVHVAAVSPQGHLLHFQTGANLAVLDGWSVEDVTDAITAAAHTQYLVQP
jgi:hypothetical protein